MSETSEAVPCCHADSRGSWWRPNSNGSDSMDPSSTDRKRVLCERYETSGDDRSSFYRSTSENDANNNECGDGETEDLVGGFVGTKTGFSAVLKSRSNWSWICETSPLLDTRCSDRSLKWSQKCQKQQTLDVSWNIPPSLGRFGGLLTNQVDEDTMQLTEKERKGGSGGGG